MNKPTSLSVHDIAWNHDPDLDSASDLEYKIELAIDLAVEPFESRLSALEAENKRLREFILLVKDACRLHNEGKPIPWKWFEDFVAKSALSGSAGEERP